MVPNMSFNSALGVLIFTCARPHVLPTTRGDAKLKSAFLKVLLDVTRAVFSEQYSVEMKKG